MGGLFFSHHKVGMDELTSDSSLTSLRPINPEASSIYNPYLQSWFRLTTVVQLD
jgi:hypothetical protein